METDLFSITPSLVLEYLYCPRFIFFMLVQSIPQHESARYKVQQGREVHRIKSVTNTAYTRKRLGVVRKETEQELYAPALGIHGKVDEVLFLDDNTAAPLDYKFAVYKNRIFRTYRIQAAMYGLLIRENYGLPVNRAFLVYTRSRNHIEEVELTEKLYAEVEGVAGEIRLILQSSIFPARTRISARCPDCCYRNICVQ